MNYGEVTNEKNRRLPDLTLREWFVIGPIVAMAIFMGVFPNVFLKPMGPSVERVIERVVGRQPVMVELPDDPARLTAPGSRPAPAATLGGGVQ